MYSECRTDHVRAKAGATFRVGNIILAGMRPVLGRDHPFVLTEIGGGPMGSGRLLAGWNASAAYGTVLAPERRILKTGAFFLLNFRGTKTIIKN